MRSSAATPEEYLNSLPPERRDALEKVRQVILKNLPKGYEEVMNWGMITYQVPLSVYADTYNKQPLVYAAFGSQKNHMAVYLTGAYASKELENKLRQAYAKAGKKLDFGKSCLRFRKLDDLLLDEVGKIIAAVPVGKFIEHAKAVRAKS